MFNIIVNNDLNIQIEKKQCHKYYNIIEKIVAVVIVCIIDDHFFLFPNPVGKIKMYKYILKNILFFTDFLYIYTLIPKLLHIKNAYLYSIYSNQAIYQITGMATIVIVSIFERWLVISINLYLII